MVRKVKMTSRVQSIWTQKGLTLVELAIVIFILSFILLLSIPRFGVVLVGQRLKSAGHFITGMVRHVYDQSTAKKRLYRLNYRLSDGELWITYLNDAGEFVEEDKANLARRRKLPTGVRFEDIIIPTEKVTEGQTYTQFFPTGLVDRSIVHLRADNGVQLSVLIHPLSGRVTIEPGYREAEVVQQR
jgi:prepilin-type N-terminal cleavage/methylation domain-containing protein